MLYKRLLTVPLAMLSALLSWAQPASTTNAKAQFKNPAYAYRPSFPFQGAAGAKYTETGTVENQLDKIYDNYGFGGIMVAPTDSKPFSGKQTAEPREYGLSTLKPTAAGSITLRFFF